jgi:hypothetical protein
MAQDTETKQDAAQHASADVANLQTTCTEAATVSQPRDPITGVFVSNRPRDAAVDAEIERYGGELDADYPNATRALREAAKHAYAMLRRLSRPAAAAGALRPSGRVPAAVREAGAWMDRLVRALESLEQTNLKRKGKIDPARARADLEALIAKHKA